MKSICHSLLRFIPMRFVPDFDDNYPQFLVLSSSMELSPTHRNGSVNGVAHTNGNGHAAHRNGNGSGSGASLPVDWERLARSTAHPLRVSVLEILGIDGGRVLSPSD